MDEDLVNLCVEFIKDNRIHSPETIYQADRVIVNAYAFIEEICNIVGYHDLEDVN